MLLHVISCYEISVQKRNLKVLATLYIYIKTLQGLALIIIIIKKIPDQL